MVVAFFDLTLLVTTKVSWRSSSDS